ncbi:hypothetical protein VTI74DRAFT_2542 [Chaetomium olivicolor]
MGQIISSIHRAEGWRAFFRSLGPSLSGVVPATAIRFYCGCCCGHSNGDYLGTTEAALPLVLYEQFKLLSRWALEGANPYQDAAAWAEVKHWVGT